MKITESYLRKIIKTQLKTIMENTQVPKVGRFVKYELDNPGEVAVGLVKYADERMFVLDANHVYYHSYHQNYSPSGRPLSSGGWKKQKPLESTKYEHQNSEIMEILPETVNSTNIQSYLQRTTPKQGLKQMPTSITESRLRKIIRGAINEMFSETDGTLSFHDSPPPEEELAGSPSDIVDKILSAYQVGDQVDDYLLSMLKAMVNKPERSAYAQQDNTSAYETGERSAYAQHDSTSPYGIGESRKKK
jgi:hypothetical protein